MKHICLKIILIILPWIIVQPVYASEIFSDSFQNGYSNSWNIAPWGISPIPSAHGITANISETTWSDLLLPLKGNIYYDIQFDVWVNTNNPNAGWGISIRDVTYGNWKMTNTWGPSNLLQVRDTGGNDSLVSWMHSVGHHHFEIITSPSSNTQFIVKEDNQEIISLMSKANFDLAYLEIAMLGNNDYEFSNLT